MPFGRADHAVPVALRETAAWLAGAADIDTRWLVEADPESLVPHSPLVDSPAVRETIVAAMLRRAGEIEVADRPWARAGRHLAHPALGRQLREVLAESDAGPPVEWESRARVRLAVRLARDAADADLVDRLLQLAEDDAWDDSTHVLAASSAFAGDPDRASDRLRGLLRRFTDPAVAVGEDPDGELRGGLLRMLWPRHIATVDVLPVLRHRGKPRRIGTFRLFRRIFAERLPEGDLDTVLRWAAEE
ncbi:hypothetical protein [Dactylosporangium sp. CA-092794]|uniref:hypothetical protein n=1 Tax=Dactylosporangium sp. CA-092794 TaxID=3239929 RepID=UPI003D8B14D4